MSIAKLFVKIFGEDIFEKLTEQPDACKKETDDADEAEGEKATISSMVASNKESSRTEDMCLPQ